MSAPLAIVEFPEDRRHAVHLTNSGWVFPGDEDAQAARAVFERLLNSWGDPDRYGPSDGDPVACAAAAAAELLAGTVVFVREPDPVPHDAVF